MPLLVQMEYVPVQMDTLKLLEELVSAAINFVDLAPINIHVLVQMHLHPSSIIRLELFKWLQSTVMEYVNVLLGIL